MKNLIFSIIIIMSFIVTSCTFDILPSRSGSKKNPNLTLWESYATDVYKIDQNNLPPEDQYLTFHLTVVDGEVELVIDTNIYLFDPVFFQNFYSIEEMFDIIASIKLNKPYQFEVEYDSVYGYPTYIFYDSTVSRNFDFFYIKTNLTELDAQKPHSYDQRKKWEALEITDYNFEQTWLCFCVDIKNGHLTVENDIIESGFNISDSSAMTVQEARDNFRTVNQLFYQIDQDFELSRYEAMIIKYDSLMHYPYSVYRDEYLGTADDEYEIVTKVVE